MPRGENLCGLKLVGLCLASDRLKSKYCQSTGLVPSRASIPRTRQFNASDFTLHSSSYRCCAALPYKLLMPAATIVLAIAHPISNANNTNSYWSRLRKVAPRRISRYGSSKCLTSNLYSLIHLSLPARWSNKRSLGQTCIKTVMDLPFRVSNHTIGFAFTTATTCARHPSKYISTTVYRATNH